MASPYWDWEGKADLRFARAMSARQFSEDYRIRVISLIEHSQGSFVVFQTVADALIPVLGS